MTPRPLARKAHRRRILQGVIVLLTTASFSGLMHTMMASPSAAVAPPALTSIAPHGPMTIPSCPGTTSNSGGTINTPSPLTFAENSEVVEELRAGKTVMLYGNQGAVYVNDDGEHISDGSGGLPYCGARVLDNGTLEVDWRFCTDQGKYGCAHQSPGSEWNGSPENPLDDEQRLQIANILLNPTLDTKRDRAKTQLQIWCISEERAEGSVNLDARDYLNYHNFVSKDPSSSDERRELSTSEARCSFLPDLSQNPAMTLTGPSETVQAGTPVVFTLTTNVTTPIRLTTTSDSPLKLCPSPQNGATFDGGTVQLAEPGSVTICTSTTRTETITVTAQTGDLPQAGDLNLLWNGHRYCQVFADYVEGAKIALEQSANVAVLGSGSFTVSKDFTGATTVPGDLDDVSIEVSYEVLSLPVGAESSPENGQIVLNSANSFTATGPRYPDGTTLHLEEAAVTGLPPALQQDGVSWSVNGQPTTGAGATITVEDTTNVEVTLTNTLTQSLGTFELRKSFAFDNDASTPPPDTEVEVRWWLKGNDYSTYETITLNEANNYTAMPGSHQDSPTLFPVGTTLLLEEVAHKPVPGVANVVDWGSNTDPDYHGTGNRGMVTVAEQWDAAQHTPGGDTSASEVTLTNGIAIDRGSLIVHKQVLNTDDNSPQPILGEGPFDDVEIRIEASWEHPDPRFTVEGSNVMLLNASNHWSAGLGVELPEGTVVTVEETAIYSVDPSIEWDENALWSCDNCDPPFENIAGDSHKVTITGAETGQPIEDLNIVLTNAYRVMTGSFSLEKNIAGDISRDDERLSQVAFTAEWQSTDPAHSSGEIIMRAPDWVAVPLDEAGDPIAFPLGTSVTLNELTPPNISGIEWGEEISWSVGDNGSEASFTIMHEDLLGEPSATISLTNFAEIHEGSFSVTKMVHSIEPADTSETSFTVSYRSPGENPRYSGTLTVKNGESGFSEAFPAGTELFLEETLPAALPNTEGWRDPQFVDAEGTPLKQPVLVTIGDGTDLRLSLINTTIEAEQPEKPRPSELPKTGAEPSIIGWAAPVFLVFFGVAVVLFSRRARGVGSA